MQIKKLINKFINVQNEINFENEATTIGKSKNWFCKPYQESKMKKFFNQLNNLNNSFKIWTSALKEALRLDVNLINNKFYFAFS